MLSFLTQTGQCELEQLCHYRGLVFAGISIPVHGFSNTLLMEVRAILMMVQWCNAICLPINIIASDCKMVVDNIRKKGRDFSPLRNLIHDICDLRLGRLVLLEDIH